LGWASCIGVDASVTSLHPPADSEAGATDRSDRDGFTNRRFATTSSSILEVTAAREQQ